MKLSLKPNEQGATVVMVDGQMVPARAISIHAEGTEQPTAQVVLQPQVFDVELDVRLEWKARIHGLPKGRYYADSVSYSISVEEENGNHVQLELDELGALADFLNTVLA